MIARPGQAMRMVGGPVGFRTHVVASRPLTPTAHAIELATPHQFTFAPTQFTFLQVLTEAGPDARPMSFAASPTRPNLEYAVRLSESPFKRAFAALRPGDEVAVIGPLGDFVLDETRPAILVAAGIGITPLKGMAEYAADRALAIPIRLVYGSRSEAEIAYRDELAALERKNPQFRVFHTLTGSTDPDWQGPRGRIDRDLLRQAAGDLAHPIYYVGGTPGMVVGTWRVLREAGIPEDEIAVEAFRGYG